MSEITRSQVVIGASAGGVQTLSRIAADLPADFPASICVVLHISPGGPSALAAILARAGPLPCRSAVDGEALLPGEILVAPPDRHLAIAGGRARVTDDPRESGHRPAVNVLFRSAAEARDVRAVGVVLSGTRNDGTAGLAAIKVGGGIAVVQDPDEALYAGMPANALAHVSVDAVVPSYAIAETLVRLIGEDGPGVGTSPLAGVGGRPTVRARRSSAGSRPVGARRPSDAAGTTGTNDRQR